MGQLILTCTASTGTRLMGIAYGGFFPFNFTSNWFDQVVLVQSNVYPSSVTDISWSFVAARKRIVTDYDNFSFQECHVDRNTGVFTLMSNYSAPDIDASRQPAIRVPGGFQYDPRTDLWSDFTLDADYLWGDVSNTFTLFTWPNTTTLYQANIQLQDGSVNLGMLKKNDDGSSVFVNAAKWTLNPSIFGYPLRFSFRDDVLYQFGSIVVDDRTGAFKSYLTKIPLVGSSGVSFIPGNLTVFNIDEINDCTPSNTIARSYRDSLYVVCQDKNGKHYNDPALVFMFKEDANGSLTTITGSSISSAFQFDLLQPISGGENSSVWGYFPRSLQWGLSFDPATLGSYERINSFINITAPFANLSPTDDSTKPIVYVVIGIASFLMLVIIILIWRNWKRVARFCTRSRRKFKRKIKAKIIEVVSKIDDGDVKSDVTLANDTLEGRETGAEKDSDSLAHKIEEMPMKIFDMDECHKILVTPDMDQCDFIGIPAAEEVFPVLDVDVRHTQDVGLQHHSRQSLPVSLPADTIVNRGDLNGTNTRTIVSSPSYGPQDSLPSPRIVPSTSQLLSSSVSTTPSSPSSMSTDQEQYTIIKCPEENSTLDNELYTSYSSTTGISIPSTPPFSIAALPSAPPLDSEQPDSSLRG
ncbi:hypothetical protein BGZ46_008870 [Entomortierella lignicola]|nr:hypothetical protein BGZ46_008870 [Entomortierella lignicola]